VERAADGDEWAREVQRQAPFEALRLDLGLLAQALGVQQRSEREAE